MDSPENGLVARPMKLKVYYTFDAQHQHNHLAKWPHILNVHTAKQSETVEIGVVDLRTCVEAITSASPELTSLVDNDFTVYAYDYTEDDAPLDSQGRLSNLVEDEDNVDDEQGRMVSGLVKKNKMAMLMGNGQEILEVKLRLTPVPRNVQMTSTQRRNSMTSNSGLNFGTQHRQSNAGVGSSSRSNEYGPNSTSPPMDTSGVEAMQQMLSQGIRPRDRSGSQAPESRPTSRAGTPGLTQPANSNLRSSHNPAPRPASRAGAWQPTHARGESFNSGYYSGEENQEEGPSRKRAKIAPVDYRKANHNIEQQPESLRVAASTASSVRLHRPTPINPATNPALALQIGASLEEPVRPPTPIPTKTYTGRPRGRPPKRNSSTLRRKPNTRTSSPYRAPLEPQLPAQESAVSSPEDTRVPSVSSTPANIPSSPPVMHDTSVFPTSPVLPQLPRLSAGDDSGFMSGNFDDIFGDNEPCPFDDFINTKTDDNLVPGSDLPSADLGGPQPSCQFPPVFDEENEAEETTNPLRAPSLPPQRLATAPPPLHRAQTTVNVVSTLPKIAPGPPPRYWGGTEREAIARANLPPIAASDPAPRQMQRSNTWTGDMSDIPMSDAPTGTEAKAKVTVKKRPGKEQTKQRLEAALANGELPPYCDNCGAIETPAWRRAYSKEFDCPFDEVETSLEDSACCYKEVTERNLDGSVKKFKGYKVTHKATPEDDGWNAISLCNPCGLWFHKSKCHRPPEKWNRSKGPKKKRNRKKKTPADGATGAKSDAPTPASDGSNGSSPAYTATDAADPDDGDDNDDTTDSREDQGQSAEPELPPPPRNIRANSAEPLAKGLRSAFKGRNGNQMLSRGIQSSPIRMQGSQNEPIEVDLTPQPIRRQLFPSPEKFSILADTGAANDTTTLVATLMPSIVRRSPRLHKTNDLLLDVGGPEGVDKENAPATSFSDDGLDDLFNVDGGEDELPPPMTPTPKRRSERILLKTPGRTPGTELSPNIQRRHPAVAALLGTSKKVSEMTPFSRQIHEAFSDSANAYAKTSPMHPPASRLLRTPKKTTPKHGEAFDFPDLPSLSGNSPMLQFNYSELTTDQIHSEFNEIFDTDVTFPSSPPSSFFQFTSHEDSHDAMWSEMGFMSAESEVPHFEYPDPTEASLNEPGPSQILRRSPRKKR